MKYLVLCLIFVFVSCAGFRNKEPEIITYENYYSKLNNVKKEEAIKTPVFNQYKADMPSLSKELCPKSVSEKKCGLSLAGAYHYRLGDKYPNANVSWIMGKIKAYPVKNSPYEARELLFKKSHAVESSRMAYGEYMEGERNAISRNERIIRSLGSTRKEQSSNQNNGYTPIPIQKTTTCNSESNGIGGVRTTCR